MQEIHFKDVPLCYCYPKDDDYVWLVTDYHDWGYEGSGEAVGLRVDGQTLDIWNLNHCSCYGPFDNSFETITVDQFRESVLDGVESNSLTEKVLELLA